MVLSGAALHEKLTIASEGPNSTQAEGVRIKTDYVRECFAGASSLQPVVD